MFSSETKHLPEYRTRIVYFFPAAYFTLLVIKGAEWLPVSPYSVATATAAAALLFLLLSTSSVFFVRLTLLIGGCFIGSALTIGTEHLSARAIEVDSYNAVFQTTLRESLHFLLSQTPSVKGLAATLLLAFSPCVAFILLSRFETTKRKGAAAYFAITLALPVTGAVSTSFDFWEEKTHLLIKAAKQFRDEKERFEASNKEFATNGSVTLRGDTRPDVVIFIGESLSKHHFSHYGYQRKTDKELDRWITQLIKFENVVSGHSHTAESLSEALTALDFPDAQAPEHNVSLVNILRAGGYHVTWLSNQNEYGVWENPITRHAKLANHVRFFRKTIGTELRTDEYDDRLIAEFERTFREHRPNPEATFIHTYAGHNDYCGNIPPEFRAMWNDDISSLSPTALFGGRGGNKNGLNCYDSAVAYVVRNLSRVIEFVNSTDRPTIVLFFSDHGENVLDGTGHDSARHSYRHVEIPFFVYFNKQAEYFYPTLKANAQKNKTEKLELSDLFHSVIDAAHLQVPTFRNDRSFFSDNLAPKDRVVAYRGNSAVAIDGPLRIPGLRNDADYMTLSRTALASLSADDRTKVCAHRSNTYFRLQEALISFGCVEVDVNISAEDVWVYHPPAPNPGLGLAPLLRSIKSGQRIWLDVKNLSTENLPELIRYITSHRPDLHKEQILIETSTDLTSEALTIFENYAKEGWQFSYYLPTEEGLQCIDRAKQGVSCLALVKHIVRYANVGKFTHLSFDSRLWPYVKEHRLEKQFRIGTWHITQSDFNEMVFGDLFRAAEWYIVPFSSPYYH